MNGLSVRFRSVGLQTPFLGLFALHLSLHSALEKAMRQDLRLIDYKEMVDPCACPLHRAMQHLGVLEGSPLEQIHQAYHKAIAKMIGLLSASPHTTDWSILKRVQSTLEEAIIDAYKSQHYQADEGLSE